MSGRLNGGSATNRLTKKFALDGDTARFQLYIGSGGNLNKDHTYYAIIEGNGYVNKVVEGKYSEPEPATDSIYEFDGWYTDPACTDGNEFNTDSSFVPKDITVYAKWRKSQSILGRGDDVNKALKRLANPTGGSDITFTSIDKNIKHIVFSEKAPDASANTVRISTGTTVPTHSTIAWFDSDTGTIYLYSKAKVIYWNRNSSYMFHNMRGLIDIDIPRFNTGQVTTLAYAFQYCMKLTNLGKIQWDTSKTESLYQTFYYCSSLTGLDLSDWNTSAVTNMNGTFISCTNLIHMDLSNWDTSQVTDMSNTFTNCKNYADYNTLNNWDISKVPSGKFLFMFHGCSFHPTFTKRAGSWNNAGTFIPTA